MKINLFKVDELGKKVAKGKVVLRTVFTIIVCVILFGLGILGASAIVTKHGVYTVSIAEGDVYKLTLSETIGFENPSSNLNCPGISAMTNIAESKIATDVDDHDGTHNGEFYIAYTFYIKNVGNMDGKLIYHMDMQNIVLGADAAVRVKCYEDGVPTTYAKIRSDGNPEEGTTPFNDTNVFYKEIEVFEIDEIKKFTIVIWLEGNDEDCLDSIIGGNVGFTMDFSISEIDNNDD